MIAISTALEIETMVGHMYPKVCRYLSVVLQKRYVSVSMNYHLDQPLLRCSGFEETTHDIPFIIRPQVISAHMLAGNCILKDMAHAFHSSSG